MTWVRGSKKQYRRASQTGTQIRMYDRTKVCIESELELYTCQFAERCSLSHHMLSKSNAFSASFVQSQLLSDTIGCSEATAACDDSVSQSSSDPASLGCESGSLRVPNNTAEAQASCGRYPFAKMAEQSQISHKEHAVAWSSHPASVREVRVPSLFLFVCAGAVILQHHQQQYQPPQGKCRFLYTSRLQPGYFYLHPQAV
jgi:hypothetical protein